MALALGACGDDEKKPATTPDAGKPDSDGNDTDGDSQEPVTLQCGGNECMAPQLGGQLGGLLSAAGGAGGGGQLDAVAPEVCCAGEAEDKCGAKSALLAGDTCFEQGQVGRAAAPTCPNLPIPLPIDLIKFELKGCCKPSNECGLDLSELGVGCMERTEVSKVAMEGLLSQLGSLGVDAGMPEPLEAIGCDFAAFAPDASTPDTDASVDDDAGTGGDTDAGAGDAGADAAQ
jgi:hypothetical protein